MEYSERLLYHIWDAQHIIKKPNTVSGKQVIVMYPGQWNTDFGADFRNGIVNINGEVLRGNIEIHRKTYDWVAHKHNEDANFNNTVLHVVYEHNGQYPYTITEDGSQVEILELKDYLDQDLAKLIKKFDQASVYYPELCRFFAGLDNDTTRLLLINLGISRMKKKVKRYAAELYFSDFNQLLYQGLMEAGGYSKNSYNMLHIAMTYPYVDILEWKNQGMTLKDLQSIYLWGSGLGKHIPKSVPLSICQQWEKAYQYQQYTTKNSESQWNLFRVRPGNHPVVRIIQLSNFIYHSLNDDLLNYFINLFSPSIINSETKRGRNESSIRKFTKDLIIHFSHNLFEETSKEDSGKRDGMLRKRVAGGMGYNRLDIIIINVVLPVMILYADKVGNQSLRENVWAIYKNYKGLSPHHIDKLMGDKYLNDTQRNLVCKKAVYQQGILKLFMDYCRYNNCSLCQTHKKDLILSM